MLVVDWKLHGRSGADVGFPVASEHHISSACAVVGVQCHLRCTQIKRIADFEWCGLIGGFSRIPQARWFTDHLHIDCQCKTDKRYQAEKYHETSCHHCLSSELNYKIVGVNRQYYCTRDLELVWRRHPCGARCNFLYRLLLLLLRLI